LTFLRASPQSTEKGRKTKKLYEYADFQEMISALMIEITWGRI